MKNHKKHIALLLLAVMLVFPLFTHAEGIDLLSYAKSTLTEVFGYTREEAEQFVYGEQDGDTLAFWHPDHPDWIYTVCIDRQTGRISGTSPFDTGYVGFCGENAVKGLIHTIREEGIFADWNAETRQELLSLLDLVPVRISTELYFAENAGNAVHGFFESCYGPEFGWTEPLRQQYQGMMDEYHLAREPEHFHQPGIRQATHLQPSGSVRTLTLFEGEIPEAWRSVLSDSHLDGWLCSSGAIVTLDWSQVRGGGIPRDSGSGLAAFEKDGRRQLIQLTWVEDGWKISPLGINALYQDADYKVTYDGIHGSLAVVYQLNVHEQASFFLVPRADRTGYTECAITAYERLDTEKDEAVWISIPPSGMPTWERELGDQGTVLKARFPYQVGLVPIDLFPTTPEEATENNYPGLPENYVMVNGVNFREKTSSRSCSYGELKPGVILPVLDIQPGDPEDWIHTRLGSLEGYVVTGYTSWSNREFILYAQQPVAEATKEIAVKEGTGWFDGTVGSFPAGTKMHVVFENGDWLYVDIPRNEMNWLMDPEGTFGYVKKNDVVQATTTSQLDWLE